jgi:DNA-binding beta-propeller fold protein YncE
VNRLTRAVLVLDTITKTVVGRVIGPEDTDGIAVAADGKHAYATGGKSISVLGTSTNTVENYRPSGDSRLLRQPLFHPPHYEINRCEREYGRRRRTPRRYIAGNRRAD